MTKQSDVSERLGKSVIAVPPLARNADMSLYEEGNRKILEHLDAGGVTTALYGGNANLYNQPVSELLPMLDMLEKVAPRQAWIIPSVGPDFGKAEDQLMLLKSRAVVTAMVLPISFPSTSAGVATGLRKLADRFGRPLIAYIKAGNYINPTDLAGVVSDGAVCAIKYALVRDDPANDPYLDELVSLVDPRLIVSGIGERPAIVHLTKFRLNAFTSGSVCVAPALSTAILKALKEGRLQEAEQLRKKFLPLEDLRDEHSPLRVLHSAIASSGIASTGPLMPFLSNLDKPPVVDAVKAAAASLLEAELDFRRKQSAPAMAGA